LNTRESLSAKHRADLEDIETMKVLSPNMAWLLKMLHVAC
jgi:hypothetical protein